MKVQLFTLSLLFISLINLKAAIPPVKTTSGNEVTIELLFRGDLKPHKLGQQGEMKDEKSEFKGKGIQFSSKNQNNNLEELVPKLQKKGSLLGSGAFLGLLTLIFITLKLINKINWSWWWVLAPIWGPFAIGVAIGIIYFILDLIFGG